MGEKLVREYEEACHATKPINFSKFGYVMIRLSNDIIFATYGRTCTKQSYSIKANVRPSFRLFVCQPRLGET